MTPRTPLCHPRGSLGGPEDALASPKELLGGPKKALVSPKVPLGGPETYTSTRDVCKPMFMKHLNINHTVQLILLQVHLHKPCYDFSFLEVTRFTALSITEIT